MTTTTNDERAGLREVIARIVCPASWTRRAALQDVIEGRAKMPDDPEKRAMYLRSANRRVDTVVQDSLSVADAILASIPAPAEEPYEQRRSERPRLGDIDLGDRHPGDTTNTPPSGVLSAPAEEPVAWMYQSPHGRTLEFERATVGKWISEDREPGWTETPLYTHQPAAEQQVGEREAIVAWLRAEDSKRPSDNYMCWIANQIERGDHLPTTSG